MLLAWLVVAGVLLSSAREHLEASEDALPLAREAIASGDLDAARTELDRFGDEARAALGDLDNPLVRPLRVVPVVGTDLRAATAIARAGADLGTAADRLLETLSGLPGGFAALGPRDGRLPVDAIASLDPDLQRLAATVAEAHERVATSSPSGQVAAVTAARTRVLELLEPLVPASRSAAALAQALPTFLGADGPRTYLFGASTPAELRGTGGFIGSVALLTIDEGRLDFGPFTATSDLPYLGADAIPPPVQEDATRWSRYGGTGSWHALHRTPHFPAAAAAMEAFWMETEGDDVDGMIVVDPFALATLLELSGPVEHPAFGTLDAGSVVDYVTNEAYAEFDDPDERKQVLGAVAATTFEGFLRTGTGTDGTREVVDRLGQLVAGGHLLLHAADDDIQAGLVHAGATGELGDPSGDLLNVVINSGTASKVDFYAERRIEHTVTLLDSGATRNELELTLGNEAPTSGPPSYVIGPNNESLEAGDNLVDISVYASRGARFTSTPSASEELPGSTGTELGRTVHDGWLRLASGESVTQRYTWVTPDAWHITDDGKLSYELLFQGQTVIRPTDVTLRIQLPDGLRPVDVPDDAAVEDGALVWSGAVRGEDVRLQLLLERDPGPL